MNNTNNKIPNRKYNIWQPQYIYCQKYMGKIFEINTKFKQLAVELTHCHRKRRRHLVLNLKHEDKGIVALCKFKLNLSNEGYGRLPYYYAE